MKTKKITFLSICLLPLLLFSKDIIVKRSVGSDTKVKISFFYKLGMTKFNFNGCEIKYKYFVKDEVGGFGNPSKRDDGFLITTNSEFEEYFPKGSTVSLQIKINSCKSYAGIEINTSYDTTVEVGGKEKNIELIYMPSHHSWEIK